MLPAALSLVTSPLLQVRAACTSVYRGAGGGQKGMCEGVWCAWRQDAADAICSPLFQAIKQKRGSQPPTDSPYCIRLCCCFCCRRHLQGAALAELQAFFPALAASNAPSAKPEALLKMLLDAGRGRCVCWCVWCGQGHKEGGRQEGGN